MQSYLSWNWQDGGGGTYSFTMLADSFPPDSLLTGVEEYEKWNTNGAVLYDETWLDQYNSGFPPNRHPSDMGPANTFSGFPWAIEALSDVWKEFGLDSYNAKATIQLKTGGKNGSKLKNVFRLAANATGCRHLNLADASMEITAPSDSYSIPANNISVVALASNSKRSGELKGVLSKGMRNRFRAASKSPGATGR